MHSIDSRTDVQRQKGTTLVVTIVLVLLASLLALFAMNVGIFEQRSSGNDVKARLVQQTAEAALAQGVEYLNANRTVSNNFSDTTKWKLCDAADTTFPCNTVPQCANNQSDGSGGCKNDVDGVSTARRGKMYYYVGGAGYDVNGVGGTTDVMDKRSLPLDRLINGTTTVGTVGNGFSVNYGVGVVACMVKTPVTATSPTECTTDKSQAAGTYIYTLTSVAGISGESAKTTLSDSFGFSISISNPLNKPPIVASGSVDITGGIQVVTNPDSAGHGVPVSIWTRKDVQKTGTPNTCYMEDYLRQQQGQVSIGFEPKADGTTSDVITCDDCQCTNSLSYASSGNTQEMGIDILDVDNIPVAGTSACTAAGGGSNCKVDSNVRSNEFPKDLFNLVFGVQAWADNSGTNPDGYCDDAHDCFGETRIMTTSFKPADGSALPAGGIGVDEAYLYEKAKYIVPNSNLHPVGWIDPSKLDTNCASFATSSGKSAKGGIIWVQDPSKCNFKSQIGTVDKPVVLVVDGNMTGSNQYQGRMFGILFVRAPDSPLDPTTGGSVDGSGGSFRMNAGSVIYGSVVVQGQFIKGNGTSAVVYSSKVLGALLDEPALNPPAPLPGSWTDRFAY